MRVVVYARVSSEQQAERDLSIPAQLKEFHKRAKSERWEIVREFVDEAQSARTADRPAFQELISFAKRKDHPIDAIVVWKLSRFARNREDSVVYKSLLRRHDVQVLSLTEQIDDSPTGRLLEGVLETIDEFYSLNLAQESMRGKNEAFRQGRWPGGCPPFGYVIARTNGSGARFEIDPERALIVREVFRSVLSGGSLLGIARELNDRHIQPARGKTWWPWSILKMVRNDTYTGVMKWRGERREEAFEPIVDRKLWQDAQDALDSRNPKRTPPRIHNSVWLLTGLLRCGTCGAKMNGHYGGVRRNGAYSRKYYMCKTRAFLGTTKCDGCVVDSSRLDAFVIDRVKKCLLDDNMLRRLNAEVGRRASEQRTTSQEALSSLRAQLARTRKRRENLLNAIERGVVKDHSVGERLEEVMLQIKETELALAEHEARSRQEEAPQIAKKEVLSAVRSLESALDEEHPGKRKAAIRSLISEVTVLKDGVKIKYSLPYEEKFAQFTSINSMQTELTIHTTELRLQKRTWRAVKGR